MATRILVFDPLHDDEIAAAQNEINLLLSNGWNIVASLTGNRTGQMPSQAFQTTSQRQPPIYKDYVLIIFYLPD